MQGCGEEIIYFPKKHRGPVFAAPRIIMEQVFLRGGFQRFWRKHSGSWVQGTGERLDPVLLYSRLAL